MQSSPSLHQHPLRKSQSVNMFIIKAFLLTALAAAVAHANPVPEAITAEGLVVVDTKVTEFGTLTYYGRTGAANTTSSALAPRACGSNDVTCDGSNVPDAETCTILINEMQNFFSTERTAVAVCITVSGQCCVSWHDPAGAVQEQHLVHAAQAAWNGCVVHGLSGATSNTNLEGTCTRQCLSNRPDFC